MNNTFNTGAMDTVYPLSLIHIFKFFEFQQQLFVIQLLFQQQFQFPLLFLQRSRRKGVVLSLIHI